MVDSKKIPVGPDVPLAQGDSVMLLLNRDVDCSKSLCAVSLERGVLSWFAGLLIASIGAAKLCWLVSRDELSERLVLANVDVEENRTGSVSPASLTSCRRRAAYSSCLSMHATNNDTWPILGTLLNSCSS